MQKFALFIQLWGYKWNAGGRKQVVMIITNLILVCALLPLFAVRDSGWIWLVYPAAFVRS